jgi:hypothetical protein
MVHTMVPLYNFVHILEDRNESAANGSRGTNAPLRLEPSGEGPIYMILNCVMSMMLMSKLKLLHPTPCSPAR